MQGEGGEAKVLEPASQHCRLSERESDIIRCLVHGKTNKLIARHLGITESTVKVHLKTILRKLRVSNRTQAALWAVQHGFSPALEPPPPAKNHFIHIA